MSTIGMACNFHREPNALPGLIANAKEFFDDMVFISSPPAGTPHCEESCQIVRDAGCRLVLASVDRGFGVLRTRCIRESKADWVMIMDADERVLITAPNIRCSGTQGYPEFKEPDLKLTQLPGAVDQYSAIHHFINHQVDGFDAIRLKRRHWLDSPEVTNPRACQNWELIPDYQLRLVRNSPYVFYNPDERMHEKILDSRTWSEPRWIDGPICYEHFHVFFKGLDQEKNKLDMATYKALDEAGTRDMWLNAQEGAQS